MSRIRTYLGPKVQVTPDDIGRYEKPGNWAAEEKRDGAWAEVKTDADGKIVSLRSRVGKPFTGDAANGLVGLPTSLPNSLLVGELETASQAATDRYRALGYRRIHIFDAPLIAGFDLTTKPYEDRRHAVEEFVSPKDPEIAKRILIVKRAMKNFEDFYKSVMADGGEGLVFKRLGSLYRPIDSDGKVEEWVRCKPYSFVDYIVLAVGRSASGCSENLKVGLLRNGKPEYVCTIKNLPHGTNLQRLVGTVIECKGAEVMKSGALRHGHYVRPRPDKPLEACTFDSLGG